jgi:ketosteroid isomerase-like protein
VEDHPDQRSRSMPTIAEDRDDIAQLMYRYNHLIDSGDAKGWAETFTEDAVFEAAGNVMTGREALTDFASTVHGIRHVVVNPWIEVEGDSARVRAYIFFLVNGAVRGSGAYEDQVVRTPEGWRFAKRVFTADVPSA